MAKTMTVQDTVNFIDEKFDLKKYVVEVPDALSLSRSLVHHKVDVNEIKFELLIAKGKGGMEIGHTYDMIFFYFAYETYICISFNLKEVSVKKKLNKEINSGGMEFPTLETKLREYFIENVAKGDE